MPAYRLTASPVLLSLPVHPRLALTERPARSEGEGEGDCCASLSRPLGSLLRDSGGGRGPLLWFFGKPR